MSATVHHVWAGVRFRESVLCAEFVLTVAARVRDGRKSRGLPAIAYDFGWFIVALGGIGIRMEASFRVLFDGRSG